MKVVRETAVAGKTIYRNIKVPSGRHSDKRRPRTNPTSEKVQKNNDRLAARNLTLLLNANFSEKSGHFILTYAGDEPTQEEAEKELKKFIRRLQYGMKKSGQEMKYIVVTEYKHKRIHHHIVINTLDAEMVNKAWAKGYTKMVALDDTGNYQKLAEYLIKETSKTFREPGSTHHRRWSGSRNLVRPVIKREYVPESALSDDPKPIDGYTIPEVRRYEHPVTGLEYIEYFMVAVDEPRRYKVWPRGEVVSGKEYYKPEINEQEEIGW